MILTDLQRTSDTINHQILLGKFHAIAFSVKKTTWFKSYLSCLAFNVNMNNHSSDLSKISCSVPQGFLLGSRLYLLYVNDMQTVYSNFFICRRFRLNILT